MSVENRVTLLRANDERLTGIDFVQVIRPNPEPNEETDECDPFRLKIYFHTDVRVLRPPFTDDVVIPPPDADEVPLTLASIVIHDAGGDPLVPNVPLVPGSELVWEFDANACRSSVTVSVESPGDFRNYRLRIDDPIVLDDEPSRIDPFFNDVLEIFAALGDELSYVQDRHAREAFLETATERRTLRKKARLLDYDIHDGRSATALLELRIASALEDGFAVKTGTPVWAANEGGPPVRFEVGIGLRDPKAEYPLREGWNAEALVPYWFDASKKCLDVGATELFIAGEIPDSNLVQAGTEDGDRLMLLRSEDPAHVRASR